jgi:hypothetical protein
LQLKATSLTELENQETAFIRSIVFMNLLLSNQSRLDRISYHISLLATLSLHPMELKKEIKSSKILYNYKGNMGTTKY